MSVNGLDKALDEILAGSADINVVVGPAVWHPGAPGFFMIATADEDNQFRCDQIIAEPDQIGAMRTAFFGALRRRRPIVIHDMVDELEMAKLCAALWPGERIAKLCRTIAERAVLTKGKKGNSVSESTTRTSELRGQMSK